MRNAEMAKVSAQEALYLCKFVFLRFLDPKKPHKHLNFETYHGFHGNLFRFSVGKTPKTAKTN